MLCKLTGDRIESIWIEEMTEYSQRFKLKQKLCVFDF